MPDRQLYDGEGNPISPSKNLYDGEGNPIIPSNEETKGKLDLDRITKTKGDQGTYKSPTAADRFRYYAGGMISNLLPAIGGTVGGIVATPETGGVGAIPGAFAGAGLGSTAAEELKNEFPRLFGSRASSIPDLLTKIGGDAVTQGAIPEGIGQGITAGIKPVLAKILASKLISKTSPAVQAGVKYTTDLGNAGDAASLARGSRNISNDLSVRQIENARDQFVNANRTVEQSTAKASQYTTNPINILENGAKMITDPVEQTPEHLFDKMLKEHNLKSKFLAEGAEETPELKNPIEEQLRTIKNSPPGTIQQVQLNKLHKSIISDPANFRNYILATGDKAGAEQLAVNDVISQGYGKGSNTINPDKILDSLEADKNNIYKEGITPETKKNLTSFLTELKNHQDIAAQGEKGLTEELATGAKAGKVGDVAVSDADKKLTDLQNNPPKNNNLLSYRNGKLLLAIPIAATVGGHAAAGVAGAITGSIILKEAGIAALMKDPVIAKLTTQALKVGLNQPESTPLAKALLGAMRGSQTLFKAANDPDAKLENAQIDKDGQLQYASSSK